MTTPILIVLLAMATLLAVAFVLRPSMTRERGGKILAFVGVFLLPTIAAALALQTHMDNSRSTQFCLSCHAMGPYGKSLLVDDAEYLPAFHYQNGAIDREKACYTCHTEYTLYGGVNDKLRGFKHMIVNYFGGAPDSLGLYERYSNRECLHCHGGSRSFLEGGTHNERPSLRDSIVADKYSCMSSGCHDVIHNVKELGDVGFWSPDSAKRGTPHE